MQLTSLSVRTAPAAFSAKRSESVSPRPPRPSAPACRKSRRVWPSQKCTALCASSLIMTPPDRRIVAVGRGIGGFGGSGRRGRVGGVCSEGSRVQRFEGGPGGSNPRTLEPPHLLNRTLRTPWPSMPFRTCVLGPARQHHWPVHGGVPPFESFTTPTIVGWIEQ